MADLAQLTRWRDALMAARYQGVRTVEYDGHRVTNATDTEMAAVLGDLERRIAEYGGKRVSVVRIQSSKGFWPKKTFIQPGDVITATAPTGSVASSDGIIVGSQFGVAAVTTAEGGSVEVATTGVHKLPKDSLAVITVGDRVSWDAAAKQIKLRAVPLYPVGVAPEAVGSGVRADKVRLDDVATIAA